jgi:Zn-finger nucleic acid-binding protein
LSTLCAQCQVELRLREVRLHYLENTFSVELPACPQCGQVYVSEDLAHGRMREVEQMLEDK